MKKEQRPVNQDFYTTLDAYLSGYLALKGFKPNLIVNSGRDKVIFSFQSSQGLFDCINGYNKGGEVGALHFAMTIKSLKSQIHSIRDKDHEKRNDPRGTL